MHTTYFIQALYGSDPLYGAIAEKPLQNADFAMKQTNICRLSGDIKTYTHPPHRRLRKLALCDLRSAYFVWTVSRSVCLSVCLSSFLYVCLISSCFFGRNGRLCIYLRGVTTVSFKRVLTALNVYRLNVGIAQRWNRTALSYGDG